MNKLESLRNSLSTFNVYEIIREVLKRKDVQGLIIKFIQDRLYKKGETGIGEKLRTDFARSSNKRLKGLKGAYSKNTEIRKRADGLPDDHVTLYQEGKFYDSFKTDFKTDQIDLSANFRDIYDNFQDSFSSESDFEKAILDITDEEKEQIFDVMYPYIVEGVNKWLVTF